MSNILLIMEGKQKVKTAKNFRMSLERHTKKSRLVKKSSNYTGPMA